MAFNIGFCSDVEFRRAREGVSDRGPWLRLICEDEDGYQLELSVNKNDIRDVKALSLRKGDVITVSGRAVARADGNSYLMLTAVPVIVADSDGVFE